MTDAVDANGKDPSHPTNQRISPYLSKVVSPATVQQHTTPALSLGPGKFKESCANGAIHSILNKEIEPSLPGDAMEAAPANAPAIEILGDPVQSDARFMVDRLADKAAYIDHRIATFERDIEAACGEGYPHSVGTASQNATYFVGRVCCDTEDGRLNPQSVVLEGSTAVSNGTRVKLDLSGCSNFRLFPGQVVCVKGTNPSGFCIVASEVLPGLPLKQENTSGVSGGNFSSIVAAGPYTTNEDLRYEPLAVLLDYAATAKPDVLLLSGPFVDADHPMIRDGLAEETFDQLFESRVLSQLRDFSSRVDGSTRILLLPSPRDVHHDLTFPQGPQSTDAAPDMSSLTSLPNPCTFKCNNVVVGCSSVDWLMACTKEETSQSTLQVDRLPTLAAHIVSQRSYFPLFPPPTSVPLDTSRGFGLELPCTPHVLVTASDLAPFAKVAAVERPQLKALEGGNAGGGGEVSAQIKVVCINPGRLTKGANAGTFAQVWWVPSSGTGGEQDGGMKCRVEVKKL